MAGLENSWFYSTTTRLWPEVAEMDDTFLVEPEEEVEE